jgi:hypothetical protein
MTLPIRKHKHLQHVSNENEPSDESIQPVRDNTRKRNTRSSRRSPEVITAKKYDTSHGYPKGLPDGPEAVAMIKGKPMIIHGTPWEKLNDETRKDLDENPLDEAGELRIFVPDGYEIGSYIELGSRAKAEQFRKHLNDMKKKLL